MRNPALHLSVLALVILLCAGCSGQRTTDNGYIKRGEISVKLDHKEGVAGRWDYANMTILLSHETNGWTLAHELAHAADDLGGDYEAVCRMVGNVNIPRQMEILALVRAEAKRISGPKEYWKALKNVCGPQAVYHSDILASITFSQYVTH